jgi:hypothetical protein
MYPSHVCHFTSHSLLSYQLDSSAESNLKSRLRQVGFLSHLHNPNSKIVYRTNWNIFCRAKLHPQMSISTVDDLFKHLNLDENEALQEPASSSNPSAASDTDVDSVPLSESDLASDTDADSSESGTDLEDETIHLIEQSMHSTVKIMHGTFPDFRGMYCIPLPHYSNGY